MSKNLWTILTLALVLGASLIVGNSLTRAEAATNVFAAPPSSDAPLFMSFKDGGTFGANALVVEDEDIVSFDGTGFQMYFDGSDVGLASLEIDAINIASDTEIQMSFSQDILDYSKGIRYFIGVPEQRAMERFGECLEQINGP